MSGKKTPSGAFETDSELIKSSRTKKLSKKIGKHLRRSPRKS